MDRVSYDQAYEFALNLFKHGFNHVNRGRNNWVFEKGEQILTIPRHERVKSYELRVNASRFLASKGRPLAEILEYSPEKLNSPEYLIVKKVEGINIDLVYLSEEERRRVHFSAGEILSRIHQIEVDGYGRLDTNLKGENVAWIDFTDSFFEESLRRLALNTALAETYLRILEKEYGSGKNILDLCNKSHFLHADFHLGNLLFKDSKAVAILDLDLTTAGDPNWDTGHYCRTFNVDRINGVRSFREGYGNQINPDAERLYSLMIWARKVGRRLYKDLRLFRRLFRRLKE